MTNPTLYNNETEISHKEVRNLFSEKKYTELISKIENIPRDKYLEYLYQRSKKSLEDENKEPATKFSFSGLFKKDPTNSLKITPAVKVIKPIIENIENIETAETVINLEDVQSIEKVEENNILETKVASVSEPLNKIKISVTPANVPPAKTTSDTLIKLKNKIYNNKRESDLKKSEALLVENIQKQELLAEKEKNNDIATAELLKKEIHNNELKMASNVQTNLLPEISSDILLGIDTAVKSLNCSELSGDVYDFIVANEDETIFYLGDVTGHGTAAGLIMTMINCLTHSIVSRTTEIADVLVTLNKEIKPKLAKNMFTSIIMCKWNHGLKKLTFAGAGHEYILHYHFATGEVEKIQSGGIAIGMLPDISKIIKEKEIILENGDIIVLYTDGINEAWDEKKQNIYDLDRVIDDIKMAAKMNSAKDIMDIVFDNVRRYQGSGERTDDMTLMVFRRKIVSNEDTDRQKYLKKKLQKDILKDEVAMKSDNEDFNPDLCVNQDDFVSKNIALANIYRDEGKNFQARETIRKALNISPQNEELQRIYKELDLIIFEENLHGGIWGKLKKFIAEKLYAFNNNKKNIQDNYIKLLHKDIESALFHDDIKKSKQILEQIKALDPKNKLIPHIEKQISKKEKSLGNSLNNFFSLDVNQAYNTDNLKELIKEKTFSSSSSVSFKTDLLKSDLDQQIDQIKAIPASVNLNYSPDELLVKSDILGLKKLMKLKNIKEAVDSVKATETKELNFNMQWNNSNLKKERKSYSKLMAKISPMSRKDLYFFIEKLSAFIKAQIPLLRSVEIIQEQAKNDGFIFVLEGIIDGLNAGKSLSQSLQQFPIYFSEMFVYLIQAGEKSGALSVILSDLANQMKELRIVKSKIKSALIYPVIIISISLLIVGAMMVFIVPKLVKVYGDTGVDLPKVTQIVIAISNFLIGNYITVLIGVILTIIGLILFGRTKIGIKIYHKLFLHIPVVSLISRQNNIMLFTVNMGILLENGIQLGEAIKIVSKVTPNYYYSELLIKARNKMIATGSSLSEVLGINLPYRQRSDLIPLEVLQTVHAGEQTGNMSAMMNSTGEMYKENVKNTVKSLSEIVEPFVIVSVGLLIGVILIAIMFPLFNLGQVLRKQ